MDKFSIKVNSISKIYKLYEKHSDRLKETFSISRKLYHKDYYALKNVSFEIKSGDTVGIIGENGAGKSTLLKIITGVLTPTEGNVEVNGKISALLELGAGFNPEYTGVENIYLNGLMMGFSREEMDKKKDFIIEFADIGEFINQPVKTYSSGMFVRLAFSVAVSIEPDILIVDEALSVGDAFFQTKSMTKMKELFERGKTVLFVTHDMSTVKSLCKNAIYLENGQIVATGPAKEVVDLYEQKIREGIMRSKLDGLYEEREASLKEIKPTQKIPFIESTEFQKRVNSTRQGKGSAVVKELKLLNMENIEIQNAEFNQIVKIRLYIEYIHDCKIGIGYHIRDSKNIEILGSNTIMEGIGEIVGKSGDRIIVEFETPLPLVEGIYNITTVLSKLAIHNRAAVFEDYTQNGYVFSVEENKSCKIWNKVYISNQVTFYGI